MSKRDDIIRHIASQVDSIHLDHPTRVAIDGVDAAGKSTLADELGHGQIRETVS